MKYLSLILLLLLCFSCDQQEESGFKIQLINNSSIDRTDAPILIDRDSLKKYLVTFPDGRIPQVIDSAGNVMPYQLDDLDNDGQWDEIATLANVPANHEVNLGIEWILPESMPEFEKRTNVRFGVKKNGQVEPVEQYEMNAEEIPRSEEKIFQMDGPAWENDKFGMRHYFDGRNTRDFFGKRSSQLVLEEVGLSEQGEIVDNYHELKEWGRDVLSVGNSLGLGGLGLWHQGNVVRLGVTLDDSVNNVETTSYQLVSEGPVRSVFDLNYENWDVNGESYHVQNRVIIWAGKYWYANEVKLENNSSADTLIVGLVNSQNDQPMLPVEEVNDLVSVATHDLQTYDDEYYLGMALILPSEHYVGYKEAPESGTSITTSYNALLKLEEKNQVKYYALGAWELSNPDFTGREFFSEFLKREMEKISQPVELRYGF